MALVVALINKNYYIRIPKCNQICLLEAGPFANVFKKKIGLKYYFSTD